MAPKSYGQDIWDRLKNDPSVRRIKDALGKMREQNARSEQKRNSPPIDTTAVHQNVPVPRQKPPRFYSRTAGKTAAGIAQVILGWVLTISSAVQSVAAVVLLLAGKGVMLLAAMLCLLGGSIALLVSGVRKLNLISRFKRYCRILGGKTQYALDQLARAAGLEEAYVRKDVKKMIHQGLFLEGHLDQEEATLITSNDTYRYFEESRRQYEQRERLAAEEAAARREEEARKAAARDPKVAAVLARGEAFLTQIRLCNDAIPGEVISGKISRMELILQKIFHRLDSDPQVVDDLKKLMNYYLPMTVKLLQAYADMDAQPIEGDTISASKQEIEETLDTLNQAYEKLLDSIFQETAMDVSSDISVLQTLLAQEGLTEDPLAQIKKKPDSQ